MADELREDYIVANGIKTHVWETGSGETVLFVHGGGAGADAWGNWKDTLPRFAAAGFRAVAIDMVGFGKTDKPDPATFEYSNQARIDHLIGVIQSMNVSKLNLVGNSMGGAASLGVCIQRPELVNKLVLLGSAGRHRPVQRSEELNAVLKYTPGREQMYKIVRGLTNPKFEVDEAMVDYRLALSQSPGTMEAYIGTMKWVEKNGMFYEDEELQSIPHKTLVIHGKNDRMVPIDESWEICRLIENAWMHIIPNCGHWAMIEHPDEFCAVTLYFLKNA
ncbi:alpha/beta fold hydrolase [Kyrpidia tusciae]|uniref:Alpha/beta hydrolase fold protein n=1 Tax=Kyrpidia tusciae (strain DSM 2912 / NBRC 15312 / T2) TaxID=562970 RepID=D5WS37_KYRT2|nr:alpha/beta hydrolase [Kyrpidia tusciae]ADG06989.1 alpha/beta hydrolase fold protein [Kyrpidia tusciae DSM 2912]